MTRLHWNFLALVFFLMIGSNVIAKPFQQDTGTGATENCGDIDPSQPCYVMAGNGSMLCTKPEGCPQCAEDYSSGRTVCYVIRGATGFYSCIAKGRATDKYGLSHPFCEVSGSCVTHR